MFGARNWHPERTRAEMALVSNSGVWCANGIRISSSELNFRRKFLSLNIRLAIPLGGGHFFQFLVCGIGWSTQYFLSDVHSCFKGWRLSTPWILDQFSSSVASYTSVSLSVRLPGRFSSSVRLRRPFNFGLKQFNFKPLSLDSPASRSSLAYNTSIVSPFPLVS